MVRRERINWIRQPRFKVRFATGGSCTETRVKCAENDDQIDGNKKVTIEQP
jgi:hypothetical protein